MSRSIFVALKFQHGEAKLLYSDYCTYSAQQRYLDYDHFKKQMYKIHREHIKEGYLKSVRYQETRDSGGKADWLMLYTPGPKARVEFQTFTRSGKTIEMSIEGMKEEVEISAIKRAGAPRSSPRQKRVTFANSEVAAAGPSSEPTAAILAEFTRRGISERMARKLLSATSEPELTVDQLEWGDAQIDRARPGEIRNPAGFFIHIIQQKIQPPPGFETSRRRRLREEAQRERQQNDYHRLLLEDAHREYTIRTIVQYVEANALQSQVADLAAAEAKAIRAGRRQWPAETIAQFAEVKVRERMMELIGPALMTFEAFRQSEHAQIVRSATA